MYAEGTVLSLLIAGFPSRFGIHRQTQLNHKVLFQAGPSFSCCDLFHVQKLLQWQLKLSPILRRERGTLGRV